jgi:hypothetical protein
MPLALTTSNIGRFRDIATSAVLPSSLPGLAPSNNPITPSITAQSLPFIPASKEYESPCGAIQLSRFLEGVPQAALWKAVSM